MRAGARFLRACGSCPACLVGVRVWGALGVFGGCVRGRGRVWLRASGARAWFCVCGVAWINEKGRERELTLTGSLSLSFSSFAGRMTGLEPAAFTLGGGAPPVELRRIKQGARPTFVGCVALFECRRAGLQGAACVLVR